MRTPDLLRLCAQHNNASDHSSATFGRSSSDNSSRNGDELEFAWFAMSLGGGPVAGTRLWAPQQSGPQRTVFDFDVFHSRMSGTCCAKSVRTSERIPPKLRRHARLHSPGQLRQQTRDWSSNTHS